MDFIVTSGDREDHFSGDDSYRFNEHGLLIVTTGQGQERTYSPSGWDHLEHSAQAGLAFGL